MAEHLIECDVIMQTAEQIIIDGLKRQYDYCRPLPIPRLKTNNPAAAGEALRTIKNVGDRPLLWSTLGQSLMKHGEWQGIARPSAALKQRPDAYDYAWLADALDRLHKPEKKLQRCVTTV